MYAKQVVSPRLILFLESNSILTFGTLSIDLSKLNNFVILFLNNLNSFSFLGLNMSSLNSQFVLHSMILFKSLYL